MRVFMCLVFFSVGCTITMDLGKGDPSATASVNFVDNDNDGYASDVDCDDANPSIHPNAEEVCDGVDNDCNGEMFAISAYVDLDNDGYGEDGNPPVFTEEQWLQDCVIPWGQASSNDDCNDRDASINPGAEEVCDGVDNDCDGGRDENCVSDTGVDTGI